MTTRFIPEVRVIPSGYAPNDRYTGATFQAYADSSKEDDSGNGLTWGTAKKTLAGVVSILPAFSEAHVVVNLKGTFPITAPVYIPTRVTGADKLFILDGGDDETELETGTTDAASGSTTTSVTDSTQEWTVDEWVGYCLKITSGARSGDKVTIQSNTATTLVVGVPFAAAPGDEVTFEILKPTTVISAASSSALMFVGPTMSDVYFQRLVVSGDMVFGHGGNVLSGTMRMANIIALNVDDGVSVMAVGRSPLVANHYRRDPANPDNAVVTEQLGLSVMGGSLVVENNHALLLGPCVAMGGIEISKGGQIVIGEGCRVKSVSCQDSGKIVFGYDVAAGTDPIVKGSAGVGVLAVDSTVEVDVDMSIAGCGSHAIQLENSKLEIGDGVLSGTGNTGAGVYLRNKASVLMKDGSTPTVTGTVGNFSFDGTTQGGTWAEVDGGTPVVDLTSLSNVREVA